MLSSTHDAEKLAVFAAGLRMVGFSLKFAEAKSSGFVNRRVAGITSSFVKSMLPTKKSPAGSGAELPGGLARREPPQAAPGPIRSPRSMGERARE